MHNTKGVFTLSSLTLVLLGTSIANASQIAPFNEDDFPAKYIIKFKEEVSREAFSADGTEPSLNQLPENVLQAAQAREVEKISAEPIYSIEVNDAELSKLRSHEQVEYVEVDPPRFLLSETTPWGYNAVNAQLLSDSNAGNRTVCIIDSGYDVSHNDLSGNRVRGTNDSGTGSWSEPGYNNAHGTHVAGTIAAIANGEGVKGVMPNQQVNLHIVKVFNESGWGYSSSLVKAIQTCAENGADVVNMSLGGSQASRTEQNALQSLSDQGVLLIAAAGNDGNTAHSYPASYEAVMSVAAVDNNDDHAAFSQATDQVEIAAPGVAVLSTVTVGEGVLSDIVFNGVSQFKRGVVSHNRKSKTSGRYLSDPISGSFSGELAQCDVSSGDYRCGDLTDKVCLTERIENQRSGVRPEINAVKACYNAGARAAIVYSNSELPGLQNPFVLDDNDQYRLISVTVNRELGLELAAQQGQIVTVSTSKGQDYEYYNGTSMATPHVAGVAGLVWSYHPNCTASQVRRALTASAKDIDVAGRDNRTGYGLVDADAAKRYLDQGCNGPDGGQGETVLVNGIAKGPLQGSAQSSRLFTFDVPADATELSFSLVGGSGDADLYVSFEQEPTNRRYDCRSWESGNNERCTINDVSAGTYHVLVKGYSAYSGVMLTAFHNGAESGTQPPSTYTNNSAVEIPDNNTSGAISQIEVLRSGDSGSVEVTVDITHSYIGDLKLTLISPTNSEKVLHENSGGSASDIKTSYSLDFSGVESKGNWTLKAVDSARQDTGTINSWTLSFQ
ncbi:S8 family serine peptidase [Vibrio sp. CyArs1]|uniref:S8 family serine peptidase n=1 Tax=Vibrio sp. CyArs1 TaxID=2682577 RepID=UPI001F051955|nr:S8 family serine peptidase [Vibrio sp. CyArs1]